MSGCLKRQQQCQWWDGFQEEPSDAAEHGRAGQGVSTIPGWLEKIKMSIAHRSWGLPGVEVAHRAFLNREWRAVELLLEMASYFKVKAEPVQNKGNLLLLKRTGLPSLNALKREKRHQSATEKPCPGLDFS